MTPDEIRQIRRDHAEAMQVNGEMQDVLERYETLAPVSLLARLLLPMIRWLARQAAQIEEEARVEALRTYSR